MNNAICARLTLSPGQYSVADVQPSVICRFFSHSMFGQNESAAGTSVKPTQLWARAGPAPSRNAARPAVRHHEAMRLATSLG